jgi:hypothetical protein
MNKSDYISVRKREGEKIYVCIKRRERERERIGERKR